MNRGAIVGAEGAKAGSNANIRSGMSADDGATATIIESTTGTNDRRAFKVGSARAGAAVFEIGRFSVPDVQSGWWEVFSAVDRLSKAATSDSRLLPASYSLTA